LYTKAEVVSLTGKVLLPVIVVSAILSPVRTSTTTTLNNKILAMMSLNHVS